MYRCPPGKSASGKLSETDEQIVDGGRSYGWADNVGVWVPLSLPIRDAISIGEEVLEPLTTRTEAERGCAAERPIVIV